MLKVLFCSTTLASQASLYIVKQWINRRVSRCMCLVYACVVYTKFLPLLLLGARVALCYHDNSRCNYRLEHTSGKLVLDLDFLEKLQIIIRLADVSFY